MRLSIAAIAIGVLGAGAPAHAAESPAGAVAQPAQSTAQQYRYTVQEADLVGTPRRGAPAIARVGSGQLVLTMCAFSHDGQDWAKITHSEHIGFIPLAAVGSFGTLPRVCPNELEQVEVMAFNHHFEGSDFVGELPSYSCPPNQPFLAAVNHPNHEFPFVPTGVRVHNFESGIVAMITGILTTEVDGKRYATGIMGGTVTNWGFREQLGQVWLSCSSNRWDGYTVSL